MRELNLIIICYGKGYEDSPFIKYIITHNIKTLKPTNIEILNYEDLEKIAKEYNITQFNDYCIYDCRCTDAVRIAKIMEKPHSLYIDADCYVYDDMNNFINKYYDNNFINGYYNNNSIGTCSGTFTYHGLGECVAFKKLLESYNKLPKQERECDSQAFNVTFKNDIIPICSNELLGKCLDCLIIDINVFHTAICSLRVLNESYNDISKKIYYLTMDEYNSGIYNLYTDMLLIIIAEATDTINLHIPNPIFYHIFDIPPDSMDSFIKSINLYIPNIEHYSMKSLIGDNYSDAL